MSKVTLPPLRLPARRLTDEELELAAARGPQPPEVCFQRPVLHANPTGMKPATGTEKPVSPGFTEQLHTTTKLLQDEVWSTNPPRFPFIWVPDYMQGEAGNNKDEQIIAKMTPSQLKDAANAAWMKFSKDPAEVGCQKRARQLYTAALVKLDETNRKFTLADGMITDGDRILASQLYSNRSLLHLKIGHAMLALLDAVRGILHQPTNVKAYFRAINASHECGYRELGTSFALKGFPIGGNEDKDFCAAAVKVIPSHFLPQNVTNS